MTMQTNDMPSLLDVSTAVLVVVFLERFGFITLLSKQKQSRFAYTPSAKVEYTYGERDHQVIKAVC
jgi:hypothetical protein